MTDLQDIYESLNDLYKIILEKNAPNEKAVMYQLGFTDALHYAMSLVKEKIYEAEEKENA